METQLQYKDALPSADLAVSRVRRYPTTCGPLYRTPVVRNTDNATETLRVTLCFTRSQSEAKYEHVPSNVRFRMMFSTVNSLWIWFRCACSVVVYQPKSRYLTLTSSAYRMPLALR